MATPMAEPPHLAADLKTLCLSTMAAQWRPLAEQATRARQAPADYLAQLAHLEVTGRQERRIQRRMQEARFPMLKTLDAPSRSTRNRASAATRSCRSSAAASSPRPPCSARVNASRSRAISSCCRLISVSRASGVGGVRTSGTHPLCQKVETCTSTTYWIVVAQATKPVKQRRSG